MTSFPHRLDRIVVIKAAPPVVFRYFTDSERWANWWGKGSSIDPRPGGAVRIVHPNGVEIAGEITALDPPRTIGFTYGYVKGAPIPPGGSHVTIVLGDAGRGQTRLTLTHELADADLRDQHVQGWRYQLSLFGNVVANEAFSDTEAMVDGWFAAWSDPTAGSREATLAGVVSGDVWFHDRFSMVDGVDDLKPHLAAVHRFMPGMRLERVGAVRQCQGIAVVDWVARGGDGAERGRGTNVFELGEGGRITGVTGLWNA
jgi:uncharacterized protein YndB with AHSA1/START domain